MTDDIHRDEPIVELNMDEDNLDDIPSKEEIKEDLAAIKEKWDNRADLDNDDFIPLK